MSRWLTPAAFLYMEEVKMATVLEIINKIANHQASIETERTALDAAPTQDKPHHAHVILTHENEIERLQRLEIPGA